MTDQQAEPRRLLEHLFRHSWGHLLASLVRRFGIGYLQLIEDSVQDAFLAAFRTWPIKGIPANQLAWLSTAARNRVIDSLRRSSNSSDVIDSEPAAAPDFQTQFKHEITDDQLRLILLCCDQALSEDTQVALTLQLVCGFSTKEIAAAYLCREDTITKRIYRGKQNLILVGLHEDDPTVELLACRLDSVLRVVYVIFSEGYSSHSEYELIRKDLCQDALRLIRYLTRGQINDKSQIFALAALICFQTARLSARLGSESELLLLEFQDRRLFDRPLIEEGLSYLQTSMTGDRLSAYHLEAGIASCHAIAPSYDDTDWDKILFYYDELLQINPSGLVCLNRAVALMHVRGCDAALTELNQIPALDALQCYALYHATLADLHHRKGEIDKALAAYRRAFELTSNCTEREFLQTRIDLCGKSPSQ